MNRATRRAIPRVEACEGRALTTLIFVLNGNAFSPAGPNALTADAANVLHEAGNRVVQVSYPTIGTTRAYYGLARSIARMAGGQTIGLVGFSAGGTLAARLSGIPSLHVRAVLDDYGPPDLRDWIRYHGNDRFAQYVLSHVPFSPKFVDAMSGPSPSTAYIAAAFGQDDQNVTPAVSSASFAQDFAVGHVYTYRGGHGAAIGASRPALEDFLAHLGGS
jgi:hypothetical protein